MWEWQGDEFVLEADEPKSLWNDVNQNEDLSYMFNEITPIKDCGDLGYHPKNTGKFGEDMSVSKKKIAENTKDVENSKPNSSQVKRRRMLQFDSEVFELPYCNEQMPLTFPNTKDTEDAHALEEAFSNMSQLVSGEDTSSSGYEGLDQSSEGWLADCFNDADTQFNSGDVDRPDASDVQITGFRHVPPEHEANAIQKRRTRSRNNNVFKGKKSYMQSPKDVQSSVVYPFAFIKPCGVLGDVTLRDINKRICTPPKPKQSKEDPSAAYPTSAFSGKPVVGQMKIHTEGGKGCITIMRTKG